MSNEKISEKPQEENASHKIDFGYQLVEEDRKAEQVREVFDSVAAKYDVMNDVLSWGFHRWWKFVCVRRAAVQPGMKVLDIASGTGDLALKFAKSAGAGNVTASDINHEMLAIGAKRLREAGLPSPVVEADAEALPFADNTFDVVTVSFGVRNMTHKDRALSEMHRVLRQNDCGGRRFLPLSRRIHPHASRSGNLRGHDAHGGFCQGDLRELHLRHLRFAYWYEIFGLLNGRGRRDRLPSAFPVRFGGPFLHRY